MDKEIDYWVNATTFDDTVQPPMMGDQDLLNILALIHQDDNFTLQLPCNANSIFLNRHMCFYGEGDWVSFERNHPVDSSTTKIGRLKSQPLAAMDGFDEDMRRFYSDDSMQWQEVALPAVNSDRALSWVRNERQPVVIHSKFNVNMAGEKLWTDLHEKLQRAVRQVASGLAGDA